MNHIREIAKKFIAGNASLAEKELLHKWYDEQIIAAEEFVNIPDAANADEIRQRIYQAILARLDEQQSGSAGEKTTTIIEFRQIAAVAAVVFIAFSLIGYLYWPEKNQTIVPVESENSIVIEDVSPGGNKAVLTLADGHEIVLAQQEEGFLTRVGDVTISKTADGLLVYKVANSRSVFADNRMLYHKLTTPKSGQYQVILPDQTKVWLNAASSLKYPAKFASDKREVELDGEAYFEVANAFYAERHLSAKPKNRNQYKVPFIVKTRNQQVEVTGTKFNINAYADEEAVKTTLLEGGVRVTVSAAAGALGPQQKVLKPGEQAVLANDQLDVTQVNVENEYSWKDGNFLFNDQPLHMIMRQLSRWYDVEVDYTHLPNTRYNGFISRDVPLSRVLEMFEKTGNTHFEIKNRTIKVKP
ncbi:FecR family protein [Parapedobacter lycopersici]|uniref:FecR family protein n=1 Tax=Parapedobacter lycopersici TaxID=1864939 RepID=UPI00214DC6DA|nr:FecR family protein [Parapedobacter lycopersici]